MKRELYISLRLLYAMFFKLIISVYQQQERCRICNPCSINAYMRGRMTGTAVGFSGLLIDAVFGNVIGLYAMIMMIIGHLIGFAHKIYSRDDFTLPLIFIAVANFIYQFFYYVFEFYCREIRFFHIIFELLSFRRLYTVATVFLCTSFCI